MTAKTGLYLDNAAREPTKVFSPQMNAAADDEAIFDDRIDLDGISDRNKYDDDRNSFKLQEPSLATFNHLVSGTPVLI